MLGRIADWVFSRSIWQWVGFRWIARAAHALVRIWRSGTSHAAQMEGSEWLSWLLSTVVGPSLLYIATREEVGIFWIVAVLSFYAWFFMADRKRWNWVQWVTLLVIIVAVGSSAAIEYWDVLHDERDTESTTIHRLGLLIGGAVAIVLAVWRSRVAEDQADTAQQSLLNERYQKGAEMLGNEVLSVRLGGIYALERLAAEHAEQYHIQVMKLFCAFVRHPTKDQDYEASVALYNRRRDTNTPYRLREDVKVAMETIATRSEKSVSLEQEDSYEPDLSGAYLRGLRFERANLRHVKLGRADLTNAYLLHADLRKADLTLAHLPGARLAFAKLSATLTSADLSSAKMARAVLSDAVLDDADLTNSEMYGADLFGARLYNTNLSGADLSLEGQDPVTGLTQIQLNCACADRDNPPKLARVADSTTSQPLVWRARPCDNE